MLRRTRRAAAEFAILAPALAAAALLGGCASGPVPGAETPPSLPSDASAEGAPAVDPSTPASSSPLARPRARGTGRCGWEAVLSDARVRDGGLLAVQLKFGDFCPAAPAAPVSWQGRDYAWSPVFDGEGPSARAVAFEALLAVPYDHRPGEELLRIEVEPGESAQLRWRVVAGDYAREALSVDPRFSRLSRSALARIRRDQAKVGRIYRNGDPDRAWTAATGFRRPIDAPSTSPFGTKRIFNGQMKSYHSGLDLKAGIGTPVLAAAPGRVALAEDLFFTGGTVILDHGAGVMTLYAHLSKLVVRPGQRVVGGDLLAASGATGRVSGPHLHWGAVVYGAKVDPSELLRIFPTAVERRSGELRRRIPALNESRAPARQRRLAKRSRPAPAK